MLGSPILYIKGMRILMFQLSGFHYKNQTVVSLNLPGGCKMKSRGRAWSAGPTEPGRS